MNVNSYQTSLIMPFPNLEDAARATSAISPNDSDMIPEGECSSKYSGHMWKCVRIESGENGGSLLHYRLKEKYETGVTSLILKSGVKIEHALVNDHEKLQNFEKKQNKISPANEPDIEGILQTLPMNREKTSDKYFEPTARSIIDLIIVKFDDVKKINFVKLKEHGIYLRDDDRDFVEKNLLAGKVGLVKDFLIDIIKHNVAKKLLLSSLDTHYSCPQEILMQLGFYYTVDENGYVTLTTPNSDALSANWKQLQLTDQTLPDLKISSGRGIADDMEFVDCFLESGPLFSEGKETIHDAFVHVTKLIHMIYSAPPLQRATSYEKEISRIRQFVRPIFNTIKKLRADSELRDSKSLSLKDLERSELILGLFIDLYSANTTMYDQVHYHKEFFETSGIIRYNKWFLEGGSFVRRALIDMRRRFPKDIIDQNEVAGAWKKVIELAGASSDSLNRREYLEGFASPPISQSETPFDSDNAPFDSDNTPFDFN